MTTNNRFDAALRARVRPRLPQDGATNRSGQSPGSAKESRQPIDFASGLAMELRRDRGAAGTGVPESPKRFLRDRPLTAATSAKAIPVKPSAGRIRDLRPQADLRTASPLRPTTFSQPSSRHPGRINASAEPASDSRPPRIKKLPPGEIVSRYAPPKRQSGSDPAKVSGDTQQGASQASVGPASVQLLSTDAEWGEPFGYPSVTELAKRYAFQSPAVDSERVGAIHVSGDRAENKKASPFAPPRIRNQSTATVSTIFDKTPITARSERDDLHLAPQAAAVLSEDEERSIDRAPGHNGWPSLRFRLPHGRWSNDVTVAIAIIGLIGGLVAFFLP